MVPGFNLEIIKDYSYMGLTMNIRVNNIMKIKKMNKIIIVYAKFLNFYYWIFFYNFNFIV